MAVAGQDNSNEGDLERVKRFVRAIGELGPEVKSAAEKWKWFAPTLLIAAVWLKDVF